MLGIVVEADVFGVGKSLRCHGSPLFYEVTEGIFRARRFAVERACCDPALSPSADLWRIRPEHESDLTLGQRETGRHTEAIVVRSSGKSVRKARRYCGARYDRC